MLKVVRANQINLFREGVWGGRGKNISKYIIAAVNDARTKIVCRFNDPGS